LGCLLTERLSLTCFNPTYDKRFSTERLSPKPEIGF
jgi:hypothetical protein